MVKGYLEVEYILVVKDKHFILMEIIYDLEYENLQDGMSQVEAEIDNGVSGTALTENSTINDLLLQHNSLEEYEKNGYEIYIAKPFATISELAIDDNDE